MKENEIQKQIDQEGQQKQQDAKEQEAKDPVVDQQQGEEQVQDQAEHEAKEIKDPEDGLGGNLNVGELEADKTKAREEHFAQMQQKQKENEAKERARNQQMGFIPNPNQQQADIPNAGVQQGQQPQNVQVDANAVMQGERPESAQIRSLQSMNAQIRLLQQQKSLQEQQLAQLKQSEEAAKEEDKGKFRSMQQDASKLIEATQKQIEAANQEVARIQSELQKQRNAMQMNQAIHNQQQKEQFQQNQRQNKPQPKKKEQPKSPMSAEEIVQKLQADILAMEDTARKAKKGKYDKVRLPGGMKPKYYYAAARDYYKDMLKKINQLESEDLKRQYFAKYYTQDMANRYITSRVRNNTYRHMVDTYKSSTVMESYNKYNRDRRQMPEFGYEPYMKQENGINRMQECNPIKTNSYLYEEGVYDLGSAWEDFRSEVIAFNKDAAARIKNGDNAATKEQILEKAQDLADLADDVIRTYKGDWRGRGKPFVEEARNVKAYIEDIQEYGYEAANLRRNLREKVKSTEGIRAGFENATEVADAMVAQQLLGKTEDAKAFWERFKNPEVSPEMKYAQAVNGIDTMRKSVMRDPLFSEHLKKGAQIEDFSKGYKKASIERNQQMKEAKAREMERQKKADRVFKERKLKEQQKQNKKRAEEQKQIRKLNAMGK